MRKIKTVLFLAVVTVFMAMASGGMSVSAASGSGSVDVSVTYKQSEARSMLSMINTFRTGSDAWYWGEDGTKVTCSGLSDLAYDYDLEQVAMQRAAEIALSFSHTRPDGTDYKTAYSDMGYSYSACAENIAAGYTSASSAFQGWQETDEDYSGQGHRRTMLSVDCDFNVCAVAGVYYNGTYYWVQEFAYTTSSSSTTSANDSASTVSVNVAADTISSLSLSLSTSSLTLTEGKSTSLPTLTAQILFTDRFPNNAISVDASCTWKSGDTSVATVSNGKVTAQSAGTTKLTTTFLGKSAQISVTVTKDLSGCKMTLGTTSYTYDGSAKKPSVTVKDGSTTLGSGDYTVSYSNNKNAGTATVTAAGKGNYSGSLSATFTIKKANQTLTAKAKSSSIVKGKTTTITASGKGTITYSSNNKSVAKVGSKGKVTAKSPGKAKITVKAAGNSNYNSASATLTIKVKPKASTLKSAKSNASKKMTVKWKKVSGVTGYQIQYSTNKNFKSGNKTKKVSGASKVSKTISGLKKGKTYYVRVRTYNKVSGTNYYSSWSSVIKVKIK